MKITKYGHACLLVEENGKKLLIDPGSYTFDKDVTPELVGPVDVIIITHHHADHMDAGAIKQFLNMRPAAVIGSQQIRNDLETEGIEAVTLEPGPQQVAGFTVEAIEAAHEPIPGPTPENYAYLINGVVLHPGDSYDISRLPQGIKVLALPTQQMQ
jgi:L-ascorbate metabolism protein UlaG (beta-lactamase superfamily)